MGDLKRWIDFSILPHKKTLVNWELSEGYTVNFRFDDITGQIKIVKYLSPDKKLIIEYLGNKHIICRSNFSQCRIANIVKKRNYTWKYRIGDKIIFNEKYVGIIEDRFYRKTTMSDNSRFYKIRCSACNQLYDKFENDIGKTGCPVCSNHIIIPGINDLWTTHPNIASQLLNPEEGYKYSIGKRVFLSWKCPKCGNIKNNLTPSQIDRTLNHVVPCEKCSDSYSYPNKLMFNLLLELGVDFIPEKTFQWKELRNRRYDFYLPESNTIYELQGGLHYDKRFPEIQVNDKEKRDLAIRNGIENYYTIDCQKSDVGYIINNLKETYLGKNYDLDSLDFKKIHSLALKNIEYIAISLLKKYNYDILRVANQLQINRATVSKYLNKNIRLGLINEEIVKESQLQNKIQKHYQLDAIPLLCQETDNAFGSVREVKEYLKDKYPSFSSGSLYQSIKRNGTAYGYHWNQITREDFNKRKFLTPKKVFGDYFDTDYEKL